MWSRSDKRSFQRFLIVALIAAAFALVIGRWLGGEQAVAFLLGAHYGIAAAIAVVWLGQRDGWFL